MLFLWSGLSFLVVQTVGLNCKLIVFSITQKSYTAGNFKAFVVIVLPAQPPLNHQNCTQNIKTARGLNWFANMVCVNYFGARSGTLHAIIVQLIINWEKTEFSIQIKVTLMKTATKTLSLKVSFAILFALAAATVNAQTFTANVSQTYASMPSGKIFTSANGEVISMDEVRGKKQLGFSAKLSKVKHGIKLTRYDSSMNVVKEKDLFDGEKICGPFRSIMRRVNNDLHLFYFVYAEGREDILYVMTAKVDPVSLDISNQQKVVEIDLKSMAPIQMIDFLGKQTLFVRTSPDKSKVLVLWSKTEPVELHVLYLASACIDNTGNVYVGYKYKLAKNEFGSMVSIYKSKGATVNLRLKPASGYADDVQVVPAKNGDAVYVAGTYTGQPERVVGVYLQTISTSTFKPGEIYSKPFPPEFVEQLDKDSWGSTKAKKYGVNPFYCQAYELENGNIAITGHFTMYTSTEKSGYFRTGSIINAQVSSTRATFSFVPKSRMSHLDLYDPGTASKENYSPKSRIADSYFAFPYKGKLLIFYNDNADNLKKQIGQPYSTSNNYKNVVLAVAFMDKDGKLERKNLIDLANENFLPVGEDIIPLSSNLLRVPILKVKGLGGIAENGKWGTITIE
jgi:hypothetical protein